MGGAKKLHFQPVTPIDYALCPVLETKPLLRVTGGDKAVLYTVQYSLNTVL